MSDMDAPIVVLLICTFALIVVLLAAIADAVHPEPLDWPNDGPFCVCGQRNAARYHRHASWTERRPR